LQTRGGDAVVAATIAFWLMQPVVIARAGINFYGYFVENHVELSAGFAEARFREPDSTCSLTWM
jgi:hypothetical protein